LDRSSAGWLALDRVAHGDGAAVNDTHEAPAPPDQLLLKSGSNGFHPLARVAKRGDLERGVADPQSGALLKPMEVDAADRDLLHHHAGPEVEAVEDFLLHHQQRAATAGFGVAIAVEAGAFGERGAIDRTPLALGGAALQRHHLRG